MPQTEQTQIQRRTDRPGEGEELRTPPETERLLLQARFYTAAVGSEITLRADTPKALFDPVTNVTWKMALDAACEARVLEKVGQESERNVTYRKVQEISEIEFLSPLVEQKIRKEQRSYSLKDDGDLCAATLDRLLTAERRSRFEKEQPDLSEQLQEISREFAPELRKAATPEASNDTVPRLRAIVNTALRSAGFCENTRDRTKRVDVHGVADEFIAAVRPLITALRTARTPINS
ncbi:hypothetical protein MRY87_01000 [bacterium]|nr:hypothetical protein [bacterium]